MSDTKTYAEFYLYGLMENFVRPEEVIAWADSVIVREAHPESEIIDLSVCRASDIHEVMRCLGAVRGTVDHAKHFGLLIAFYWKRYLEKKDLTRAVGDLWHLTYHKAATREFIGDATAVDEMADYVFERLRTERDLHDLIDTVFRKHGRPNQAPEPTTMAVTPPAAQESRQP